MYSEHEQTYKTDFHKKTPFSQKNSITDVNPGSKRASNLAR